jgi:predicted acyl esterase
MLLMALRSGLMALSCAATPLGPYAPQDTTIGVIHRNVTIPMRDGVILRGDVWRPAAEGQFPTLVYRTPYNKAPVFTTYTLFRAAVARGYAVVAQDVRGRYASDGAYGAYQQEGKAG